MHSENDESTGTDRARTTTAVVTHPLAPFGTGSAREPGFALTVTFRNDSPASAVAALIGSAATRAALSVLGRGVLGAGSAKLGLLAAASGVGLVAGITIARRLRGERVGWREAVRDAVPASIEFGTEAVTGVREWWGRNEGEASATAWTVEPTGEGVRAALLEGARDEDGAWQCPYTGEETTDPEEMDVTHRVSWAELAGQFEAIATLGEETRRFLYNDAANLEVVSRSWSFERDDAPWPEWAQHIDDETLRERYEQACKSYIAALGRALNDPQDFEQRIAAWRADARVDEHEGPEEPAAEESAPGDTAQGETLGWRARIARGGSWGRKAGEQAIEKMTQRTRESVAEVRERLKGDPGSSRMITIEIDARDAIRREDDGPVREFVEGTLDALARAKYPQGPQAAAAMLAVVLGHEAAVEVESAVDEWSEHQVWDVSEKTIRVMGVPVYRSSDERKRRVLIFDNAMAQAAAAKVQVHGPDREHENDEGADQ